MGAKASRPVQSATRKFPSRAPGSAVPPPPRPAARPQARESKPTASFTKDEAIRQDGMDPDPIADPAFSQRLRNMGIATPNPTFSASSTASPTPSSPAHLGPSYPSASNNATLGALEARRRLQEQADAEFRNPKGGREFVDVGILRQVLSLRAQGTSAAEIERRLKLKAGVVARLGPSGLVAPL